MAKIAYFEECDAFVTEIFESACDQLQCKLPGAPECFFYSAIFDLSYL
jgi:hypothetical protein